MRSGLIIFALLLLQGLSAQAAWVNNCPAGDNVCEKADYDACVAFSSVNDCSHLPAAPVGGAPNNNNNNNSNNQPPPNRAVDWAAEKQDDSLFSEQANAETQQGGYVVQINQNNQMQVHESTNGSFQTQADAFNAHNSVLMGCTATNINGRTDNLCTLTPNHPECTGLNATLQNAVFCNSPPPPGSPPGTPCQSFGAYGYNIDEWLVFGQQFYNGMSTCIQTREGSDKSEERRNRMTALTDMASFPPQTGGDLKHGSSASSITGDAKVINAETRAQEMAARFDDGAAYLGFNKGELILRAYKGESFLSAFSDSPFAEKLASSLRDTVDYALGNPEDITQKAQEQRAAEIEKKKEEMEAKGETLEQNPSRKIASQGGAPSTVTEGSAPNLNSTNAAVAAWAAGGKSAGKNGAPLQARGGAGIGGGNATNKAGQAGVGGRNGILGKDGLVAAGGDGAEGGDKATGEGKPEVESQASAANAETDTSLFIRVSQRYRHYSRQMSAYTRSKTAKDIGSMETPEFFRDL